jgi:hypothetical protein
LRDNRCETVFGQAPEKPEPALGYFAHPLQIVQVKVVSSEAGVVDAIVKRLGICVFQRKPRSTAATMTRVSANQLSITSTDTSCVAAASSRYLLEETKDSCGSRPDSWIAFFNPTATPIIRKPLNTQVVEMV